MSAEDQVRRKPISVAEVEAMRVALGRTEGGSWTVASVSDDRLEARFASGERVAKMESFTPRVPAP